MSPCCHQPVVLDSVIEDRDPETGYREYIELWSCTACYAIWFKDEVEKYNAESGN